MNEFEKGYIKGLSDYKDDMTMEISAEDAYTLREYRTRKLSKHFEMIKKDYFKEIYLDGQHWQIVMIAEDGFTVKLDLKIGE